MSTEAPAWRVWLAVLLVCATLGAQGGFLLLAHPHPHSSQHCCALCHAGPVPFLQPAVSTAHAPTLAVVWAGWSPELGAPLEILLATGPSRGPPA